MAQYFNNLRSPREPLNTALELLDANIPTYTITRSNFPKTFGGVKNTTLKNCLEEILMEQNIIIDDSNSIVFNIKCIRRKTQRYIKNISSTGNQLLQLLYNKLHYYYGIMLEFSIITSSGDILSSDKLIVLKDVPNTIFAKK